ncbi:MAG: type IV pilus secretin PilQ [Deltaproteobacteria bacterium HGW-Deltaproteobacteria-10]|nr:MAG: type IV pilus secretin PilQ [Deltaproteobacteria bacterium HGW-Deltaproteobacteria-10]
MQYPAISKVIFKSIIAIVFLATCFGCADKSVKKDPFFEKWNTLAENSQGHSPSSAPKKIDISALAAKQAELAARTAVRQMPTKNINLTMRSADLKAVLRAMAKAVDLNLLMKNDIKGEVSVDFRGVAWDQAFTGLLRTYGLSYIWEGNIIRVMTLDDIDRDLKQKMSLRDIQWVEPLMQPVVINIDYADTKKLKETLDDFLTRDKDGKPRGSVKVDEHSNSLVISAMQNDLTKMLPIIEILDKPTPQIQIKANIVETTKATARDLGIMWGGSRTGTLGGSENLYVRGGKNAPVGGIGGQGLGINFPALSADAVATASGTLGLLFGTIGGNLLEVQLQALQTESKLNILSSPSITTLDNQKAFTENGQRVPFITTTTSAGTTSQTVTFEEVVLRLEITPHVIDGKNLKMTIVVKKDELDFSKSDTMGGNPIIMKKQTQTVLIVKDGETIVISGLTKQKNEFSGAGLPWFKDIPVLGWLFKSDARNEEMQEVLVFITPRILPAHSSQQSASSGESKINGTQTEKNNQNTEKN